MTGHLDKAGHSWNMSRIRGKDTNPEIAVRENVRKSRPHRAPPKTAENMVRYQNAVDWAKRVIVSAENGTN